MEKKMATWQKFTTPITRLNRTCGRENRPLVRFRVAIRCFLIHHHRGSSSISVFCFSTHPVDGRSGGGRRGQDDPSQGRRLIDPVHVGQESDAGVSQYHSHDL